MSRMFTREEVVEIARSVWSSSAEGYNGECMFHLKGTPQEEIDGIIKREIERVVDDQ